jgi:hypothetical protein
MARKPIAGPEPVERTGLGSGMAALMPEAGTFARATQWECGPGTMRSPSHDPLSPADGRNGDLQAANNLFDNFSIDGGFEP